jgi:hypothetical protein
MAQQISVLGIDIAKLVFHVVEMHDRHEVVLRRRMARSALRRFIAPLPPILIGLEASRSAHYGARRFCEHGYDVRLMAPQCVKAYVKSPKNEIRDAESGRRAGCPARPPTAPCVQGRPRRFTWTAPGPAVARVDARVSPLSQSPRGDGCLPMGGPSLPPRSTAWCYGLPGTRHLQAQGHQLASAEPRVAPWLPQPQAYAPTPPRSQPRAREGGRSSADRSRPLPG